MISGPAGATLTPRPATFIERRVHLHGPARRNAPRSAGDSFSGTRRHHACHRFRRHQRQLGRDRTMARQQVRPSPPPKPSGATNKLAAEAPQLDILQRVIDATRAMVQVVDQ
ncbi:hypothetical protein SAMN02927913_0384 [Frateuria terrea]|nr:hypothetical protein SAMN02927913_0384 [Frateuria terrea]